MLTCFVIHHYQHCLVIPHYSCFGITKQCWAEELRRSWCEAGSWEEHQEVMACTSTRVLKRLIQISEISCDYSMCCLYLRPLLKFHTCSISQDMLSLQDCRMLSHRLGKGEAVEVCWSRFWLLRSTLVVPFFSCKAKDSDFWLNSIRCENWMHHINHMRG